MGNWNEEDIGKLEEELLIETNKKDLSAKANKKIRKMLRRTPKNVWKIAFALVVLIIGVAVFSTVLSGKNEPEEERGLEVLEGFNYLVQKQEGASGANTMSEEDEAIADYGSSEDVTAGYFPTPSIQSAFPEDSLIQIGGMVYKLPVKVSDMEQSGIKLIVVGNKEPEEGYMFNPMERSGYISLDGNKYMVRLTNNQQCTYHDMYIMAVRVEEGSEDATGFYAFGGITLGTQESLLPSDYTEMKVNDFAAINTYVYGEIKGIDNGTFTRIKTQGGRIIEIFVQNDEVKNVP